jgi:creatinine amidohydrolase/Fe(II)-dependent formamide hydrolase-like protein
MIGGFGEGDMALNLDGLIPATFFFSAPGSVDRATHSGTWGDERGATVEFGQQYLDVVVEATIRMFDDIERTFEAMPPR